MQNFQLCLIIVVDNLVWESKKNTLLNLILLIETFNRMSNNLKKHSQSFQKTLKYWEALGKFVGNLTTERLKLEHRNMTQEDQ